MEEIFLWFYQSINSLLSIINGMIAFKLIFIGLLLLIYLLCRVFGNFSRTNSKSRNRDMDK